MTEPAAQESSTRGPTTFPTLQRLGAPLSKPAEQLGLLDRTQLTDDLGGDFDRHLQSAGLSPLTATGIEVLQLNLGRVCNQTCLHCHVDAGPDRQESMSHETAELVLEVLAKTDIPIVDITGGAPELCPEFEFLVRGARSLGRRVLDRCNLTVLLTKPKQHLVDFFAEQGVEVICSLPHYRRVSTDAQRGTGVFDASLEALRRLNAVGYGRDERLRLVLVTNPVGSYLPAGQGSLEKEWKREMQRLHGIVFDELHALTNMPISRYLEWLESKGQLQDYLQRLVDAFNPEAARGVMCRTMLSVGWDGRLHDCDFNQMLDLTVDHGAPTHLSQFDLEALATRRIVTRRHCFGCTAGSGSSCGGQLKEV